MLDFHVNVTLYLWHNLLQEKLASAPLRMLRVPRDLRQYLDYLFLCSFTLSACFIVCGCWTRVANARVEDDTSLNRHCCNIISGIKRFQVENYVSAALLHVYIHAMIQAGLINTAKWYTVIKTSVRTRLNYLCKHVRKCTCRMLIYYKKKLNLTRLSWFWNKTKKGKYVWVW